MFIVFNNFVLILYDNYFSSIIKNYSQVINNRKEFDHEIFHFFYEEYKKLKIENCFLLI